jgi:hypothetical protein
MANATFTTVVDRAIGDVLTEPIWDDQLKDNINMLAGAHRNLLTNGGFEVWQRGAGAFTTNLAYTADRWQYVLSLGTASITQETSITDASASALKVVCTTGGANDRLRQKVENAFDFRGRPCAVAVRVRQGAANAVTVGLDDGVSVVSTSATSATTGAYVTLWTTLAVAASATQLYVNLNIPVAGTHYFDNAMLVMGPSPAPFQPEHQQQDVARCQRYYEVHGGASGAPYVNVYGAAGAVFAGVSQPLMVLKGGTPTVTKNGTWAVTNCGQPAVSNPTASGYVLSTTVTALGMFSYSPNSTDDTITIEWNP